MRQYDCRIYFTTSLILLAKWKAKLFCFDWIPRFYFFKTRLRWARNKTWNLSKKRLKNVFLTRRTVKNLQFGFRILNFPKLSSGVGLVPTPEHFDKPAKSCWTHWVNLIYVLILKWIISQWKQDKKVLMLCTNVHNI